MFNIFYRKRGQEYQWGDDREETSVELESSTKAHPNMIPALPNSDLTLMLKQLNMPTV